MTEIYLIRHGEAEGNVFRRIHGVYNSLLTPRGHLQAACVAKRFESIRIDGCYSSDLNRTCLTSRSIYIPKGLRLKRDPRFREVNLGVWEDIPFGWLDHFEPDQMRKFNHDPVNWRVAGAETYDEYTQRFIEGMKEAALDYDGGAIAIFAHGAVIRGTLMRLFFDNVLNKLPYSDNTGVCKLIFRQGEFTYEYLNDNSHLPQELSTFAVQYWWRATGNRKDVNLYFVPVSDLKRMPCMSAQLQEKGTVLAAVLHDAPIALVSMAAPEGDCGRILEMRIKDGMDGKLYGDQLLGAAYSHFRRLGCRKLTLEPGWYPDNIAQRYQFDPLTHSRSIATDEFDWEEHI